MTKLLIHQPGKTEANETSFGGLPVKVKGTELDWPVCSSCSSKMQFQGKVATDLGVELIFMCQDDPGMCDDFDPDSGGNKVIVIDKDAELEVYDPQNSELFVGGEEYGFKVVESEERYFDALEKDEGREVLGQVDGKPDWLQEDETPNCNCCNEKMRFVAQLEEGPDEGTEMNFGGGSAYLFDCPKGKTAKFLWQC